MRAGVELACHVTEICSAQDVRGLDVDLLEAGGPELVTAYRFGQCAGDATRPQSSQLGELGRKRPTQHDVGAVSYTHLTLPTNREV